LGNTWSLVAQLVGNGPLGRVRTTSCGFKNTEAIRDIHHTGLVISLEHLPAMKDFKKYYTLPVPPETVYLALTNPLTIQLWTGEPAEMSVEPGSEFSLWDGSIVGKNLEFEPNKKIVQQWYFGDQPEPSIVTIKLHRTEGSTSIELRHTNIPDESYEDIVEGWNESYFGALQDFYDGSG
jgi:activator of HSP90 ATPase